jgi:hypothetical protein
MIEINNKEEKEPLPYRQISMDKINNQKKNFIILQKTFLIFYNSSYSKIQNNSNNLL